MLFSSRESLKTASPEYFFCPEKTFSAMLLLSTNIHQVVYVNGYAVLFCIEMCTMMNMQLRYIPWTMQTNKQD